MRRRNPPTPEPDDVDDDAAETVERIAHQIVAVPAADPPPQTRVAEHVARKQAERIATQLEAYETRRRQP